MPFLADGGKIRVGLPEGEPLEGQSLLSRSSLGTGPLALLLRKLGRGWKNRDPVNPGNFEFGQTEEKDSRENRTGTAGPKLSDLAGILGELLQSHRAGEREGTGIELPPAHRFDPAAKGGVPPARRSPNLKK